MHGCFPIGDMLLARMPGLDHYVIIRDLFGQCQPLADLSHELRARSGTADGDIIGRWFGVPGQGNVYRFASARELNCTWERLSEIELATLWNPSVGMRAARALVPTEVLRLFRATCAGDCF